MVETGFIAAIDLGTFKIAAVVGRINENGVVSVLASHTVLSDNCIRRGLVYNIEETGAKVKRLINMLENTLNKKIGCVYISVAGQSLHSETHREMKQLSSSGIVTENIIDQMRRDAEKYMPELSKKYAIADVEYFLDDQPEKNPVGVSCSRIDATYQMIVGRPNIVSNIEKSINGKAGVDVAGYVAGPLASASIGLSDEEKELGCAFIDFGAGTTSLSIYKRGVLRKLVVIPFGGRHITKDICALNFVESEAEQLKIKFGKVGGRYDDRFLEGAKQTHVDMKELNKVIEMRLDEIVINLKEQIMQSGYDGQLGAGVIITGGASQLKGMNDYLTDKLQMPVKFASAKKIVINNVPELANNPAYTQLLGLLMFGEVDCEKIEVEEEIDLQHTSQQEKEIKKSHTIKRPKSGEGFFTKVGNLFGDIFAEEEDN